MIDNKTLRFFLAIDQFEGLYRAWREQTRIKLPGSVSSIALFFAVIVSLLPALAYSYKRYFTAIDAATVAIGFATCLAILFRANCKIPFVSVKDWKKSLHLTHIAFAVGSVPLVLLLVFYPQAFHVMARESVRLRETSAVQPTRWDTIMFVLKVAVWAGLTEEFIFRGMLISAIRRWRGIENQWTRDVLAVILSSVIFGFSHFFIWGPGMAIVLTGLGFGFGVAYISIGEVLLPLIVYHILFDMLSLTISLYM